MSVLGSYISQAQRSNYLLKIDAEGDMTKHAGNLLQYFTRRTAS